MPFVVMFHDETEVEAHPIKVYKSKKRADACCDQLRKELVESYKFIKLSPEEVADTYWVDECS